MRRRHRQPEGDSLDLFLDTICNVFGGIIFIAMLIALLTAADARLVPKEHGVAEQDLAAVTHDLHTRRVLEQRLRDLEESLHDVEKQRDVLLPGADSKEVHLRFVEVRRRLQEAVRRETDLAALRDRLDKQASGIEVEIDALSRRTVDLQREISRLQAEVSMVRLRNTVEARTPVRRRTRKSPCHLVLKSGRIHALYRFRRVGRRSKVEGIEERDVESRDLSATQRLFTCKDTGGFPVTDDLPSHPRWREKLGALSATDSFFYIMVYPDSYAEFLLVKSAGLRAGFDYEVIPLGPDQPIIMVPTDEFTVE